MPWATFETNGKYCVFALDADNNKKGEALECYPSREQAQTYVKGLYAKEAKSEKAGARHSANDNSIIQKAHDALCELGATCKVPDRGLGPFDATDKLAIFKDATGAYRWIAFSSSAFRDRDREIVSTKALANDVLRADADGQYGPLRFWHEPGLDIGQCDFNAMEGRMLVESGTFNSPEIAEALKARQDQLGISIGFTHPASEPDAAGIYHTIRRFERSIVPADKASNLLTHFVVKEEGNEMEDTKRTFLNGLIGEKMTNALIGQAQDKQKAATDAGVQFKETDVKADAPAKEPDGDEGKPAFLTEAKARELMKQAFDEYEAKMTAKKEEQDAATLKATSEMTDTLKSIQSGQEQLTNAVKIALEGVAELKGELPRKLGDKQVAFVPSQNGSAPGAQFKTAQDALIAANAQLAGASSGDPLAKFMDALMPNAAQSFVQPNQPQGG